MADRVKAPSRGQLHKSLKGDAEVVRAFEALFRCVQDLETRLKAAEEKIAAEHP